MRFVYRLLLLISVLSAGGWFGLSASPAGAQQAAATPGRQTIEECQVVARIDGQVVLACEVLWRVNQLIEENRDRIPPEQLEEVRAQLMQREIAAQVDTKILYAAFRRSVPAENLPRIEENLREPFEEQELPKLMEFFKVDSSRDLERELVRLGSSLDDARRRFNERAIAGEWLRSNVKVNEEISPIEMLEYYQAHLEDYKYPAQTRWEELMVRKSRFDDPHEAYAELAEMGNSVWQQAAAGGPTGGPVFTEIAKARSDGFTAEDGGIHDWTTKGALKADVIDEALDSLEVGQLSPILETPTAFHIVRVLERKEAGRQPFTEVQSDIRDQLKQERFKAGVEKFLSELRRDARIWTIFTGPISAEELMGRKPGGSTQQR